jgi:outer membrane protein
MLMNTLARILLSCWAACVACQLQAEPADTPANSSATDEAVSPWRIGAALGYGERSNPLIQSEPIPVLVDVDIAWFGKRWFFDNGDLGFTLRDNSKGTLNLVARVNSDRVFFGRTNTRFVSVSLDGSQLPEPTPLRVPDRDYAVELGMEWLTDGRWGRLTVAAFRDVSRTHDGFSVDAEFAYAWYQARWTVEPTIMLRYKSAALNDYYWGVRAVEASSALPVYQVGSGLNWQLGARASYYLSRHLRVAASINYERLSHAVAGSPLVRDPEVTAFFAGLAYQF